MSTPVKVACAACLTPNRIPAERVGDDPKCAACGAPLLDGAPIELGEKEFDTFLARTTVPVVADFWAPWCAPCRAMAPHFERAAGQLKGKARFVKVNTDKAQTLAARQGIRAIPTIVLYEGGVEAKRASGAMDSASLARWLA